MSEYPSDGPQPPDHRIPPAQPRSPWSYQSDTVRNPAPPYGPAAADITVGAGAPGPTAGAAAQFDQPTMLEFGTEPRRRRKGPILVGIAVVAAVLLGGGAFAGLRAWYGYGAQPEEAMPSTVTAYVRLDLKPGWGERLEVNRLLEKFPGDGGSEDRVEQLRTGLFQAFDLTAADYRAHVKPWFADRIGVGLVFNGSQPYALASIASADDAAAREGLAAIRDRPRAGRMGFVVRDGFALVAFGGPRAQQVATDAARDADAETLTESAGFRDAVSKLPARQTAIAWADLGRLAAAAEKVVSGRREAGFLPDGSPGPDAPLLPGGPGSYGSGLDGVSASLKELRGQVVLGLQATGSGVELRGRGVGLAGGAPATVGDALARLGDQPGNSIVGAALRLGDGGASSALGALWGPTDPFANLPPEIAEQMEADPEYAGAKAQMEAMAAGMRSLLTSAVTLSITRLTGDSPALQAVATAATSRDAEAIEGFFSTMEHGLTASRDGERVIIRTDGFRPEGKLSGTDLYRRAMAGMPGNATVAAYVDVTKAAAVASPDEREDIEPIKAVGLAAGYDGADSVLLVRVLIG